MMHKAWCSIEEVPCYFSGSSIKFQDHTGWNIYDLNPIWVRLLGRSQLSNPSDLPCFHSTPTPFFTSIFSGGTPRQKLRLFPHAHLTPAHFSSKAPLPPPPNPRSPCPPYETCVPTCWLWWYVHVECIVTVKRWRSNRERTKLSIHIPFVSNQADHTFHTAILKYELEYPDIQCRLTNLILIWLFQNMTLKIQGQGHSSRSQWVQHFTNSNP